MASKRFSRQVALITGGGKGIGLAFARALAAEGCSLVISGRNLSTLNKAARELSRYKVQVLTVVCDVRDEASVQAMLSGVKKRFRRLDILINNAGVAHPNLPMGKLPLADWREVVDTNLTGMFLVTRAALPLMKRGGTIVNNLSVAAKRAFPGMGAYVASKHGALGFTKALREDLRPQGVRVVALMLGATATDIWNSFWPDAPKSRMMSAEDIARLTVNALTLPPESAAEELVIARTGGAL